MTEKNEIKKAYLKLCIRVLVVIIIVIAMIEYALYRHSDPGFNMYKIEINRVANELEAHGGSPDTLDLSKYETITGVYVYDESDPGTFIDSSSHYCIKNINGSLYRIEYRIDLSDEVRRFRLMTYILAGFTVLIVIAFLILIYNVIIKGFSRISEYPSELAKGNLTIPLKENRNKYFGKFLWGLNMLREKLEDEKKQNLELQKEKNVFIMSLSHDMKTPISAIKLYAQALKKGLYKDEARITDAAEKIGENADSIENYVSGIISASSDDFLDLSVTNSEFYLSAVINRLSDYYTDKLENIGTKLTIEKYSDTLLTGDENRVSEVFQNIFENAIKYGDGELINVSFSDEEYSKLITVTNSGKVLSENEVSHIFDSFYRGSNVGTKPGSGLGLYICKSLISKMGGDIFVSQESDLFSVTVVLNKK